MERGLKILQWAEEDRPREKLATKGKSSLSEAELIAILIGSGSRELSAVDLAKKILSYVDYDLNLLAKLTVPELQSFKGIGEAKAISIVSALELGRRRKDTTQKKKPYVKKSKDAYDYMISNLLDLPTEEFWVIMLTRNNKVLHKRCISQGGFSGTIVDPKVIFKRALEDMASGIILIHNHPSGNKKPSQADLKLTEKLIEAGRLLEIPVLDHIIFTDDDFFSFSDEGLL
jgi:DNA repair protein RadC